MGHRRDGRLPNAVRQDRRHRRSGPLRDSRSAEGALQRVGAWVWTRRQREGHERTRANREHHRQAGAERRCGRRVLPGDLLVLDAAHSDRNGASEPGSLPREHDAAAVDRGDEEHRLHRVPSARPASHPHDSGGARQLPFRRGGVAPARAIGPERGDDARPVEQPRAGVLQVVRRLDRSNRQRRAAEGQGAAPAGSRA